VLEVIRQIAENVSIHRCDRETILLGGDTAASMLRFSFTLRDSNKPVAFRVAHFADFRAGRLRSFRALLDTFDLVEQTLGQPIHLPRMASIVPSHFCSGIRVAEFAADALRHGIPAGRKP
jgi:hypothetical protein